MARVSEINDDQFEEIVLKAEKPVLVDFWAPWCAPCLPMGKILEELTPEYENRLSFAKVNVDENFKTASAYGILSIPTLLLFKQGKPFTQVVGLRTKRELKKSLDAALK